SGQGTKNKAPREKCVRLGVVAAEKFGAAELHGVMPADERDVVGEFVAAQDGQAGQEDVSAQIVRKTGNLQANFSRFVGDHIEALIVPLNACFILGGWTELPIPGTEHGAVVRVSGTARRETGER